MEKYKLLERASSVRKPKPSTEGSRFSSESPRLWNHRIVYRKPDSVHHHLRSQRHGDFGRRAVGSRSFNAYVESPSKSIVHTFGRYSLRCVVEFYVYNMFKLSRSEQVASNFLLSVASSCQQVQLTKSQTSENVAEAKNVYSREFNSPY